MADAMITFNAQVDPKGFEKGVGDLENKTNGLMDSMDRVSAAINRAFQANGIEASTSAIERQQAVVDALKAKLVASAEGSTAALTKQRAAVEQIRQKLIAINEVKEKTQLMEQLQRDLDETTSKLGKFDEEIDALERKLGDRNYMTQFGKNADEVSAKLSSTIEKSIAAAEKADLLREQLEGIEIPEKPKESADELARKLEVAGQKLDEMNSSEVLATGKLAESLARAQEKLEGLEQTRFQEIIREYQAELEVAANDADKFNTELSGLREQIEKFVLKGNTKGIQGLSEEFDSVSASADEANERVERLTSFLESVELPESGAASVEGFSKKVQGAGRNLDEMKRKAATAGNEAASGMRKVASETKNTTSSMDGLAKSVEKFGNHIKNLVVGAFVFNVLRKALKEFRDYIFAAAMENEAFARSFNQFKANMYAAIQPLINALLPALARVADVFAYISSYLVQIVALITNQSVQQLYAQASARDKDTREKESAHAKEMEKHAVAMAKEAERRDAFEKKEQERYDKEMKKRADAQAKAAEKQAKAEEKLADKIRKSTQETKKSVAAFDDLVTLASDMPDEVNTLEAPEFDDLEFETFEMGIYDAAYDGVVGGIEAGMFDSISEPTELTDHIKKILDTILVITGIVLLVLGVILVFTAVAIPLGLGLMVAGAVILAAELGPRWGEMDQKVKDTIALIMVIVSAALLVLGCILAFTGVALPLGIAMIVIGAAGLVTILALKWDSLSEEMKGTIITIMAIVSVAFLVLGCILAFTGVAIPLGIALIVLGVAGLVTAIAKSDALSEDTRKKLAEILLIVGAALLVLGVILCVVGIIPIGVACIVAGVGAIVAAVALDKNAVLDMVSKAFEVLKVIAMGGLVVLGIILCVTGLIPLGIALLKYAIPKFLEGLEGLGVDTSGFINFVSGVMEKVKDVFDSVWARIKYGAALVWWGIKSGVIGAVNFVIDVLNAMIEGVLAPFNTIIAGLNEIPGVTIARIAWQIPKITLPPMPQMPALARGAVLPGGAPFMAVVNDQPRGQTNVEAPLDTIKQALYEVMAEMGTGDNAYIARIEGDEAGLFRYLNIRLERAREIASAFA